MSWGIRYGLVAAALAATAIAMADDAPVTRVAQVQVERPDPPAERAQAATPATNAPAPAPAAPAPAASAPAAPAPRVELFSPRGEAKQVRHVTARFSAPIVALGDPRLEDPFTISCAAPGKGRWVDTRNWAYDFESDLPAGLRCTFGLKPALKTLDGRAIAGTTTFTFNTGGPTIQSSYPQEGWSPRPSRRRQSPWRTMHLSLVSYRCR